MRRNRNYMFGLLALLVSVVAVGMVYAGFTQTLNINGTGNVVASSWNIYFANLSNAVTTGSANLTTPATISPKTKIGNYAVTFYEPGDSLTYTFDVTNQGDFDAVLSTLTKNTPTCTPSATLCNYLRYTLTYTSGGANVTQNNKLLRGQTKNITLKLMLDSSMPASALPTSTITISNLGITLLYSQDSGYGGNSSVPTVSFITRQNANQITPEDEVAIGDEHFYVVSSDTATTLLLAKYDLKSDGNGSYMQDTSGTYTNMLRVNFLDSNNIAYWDECEYSGTSYSCTTSSNGLKSAYADSLNPAGTTGYTTPYPEVYDSNAVNIYPVVQSYANKIAIATGITVTGKLMTLAQAKNLSTNVRKDMNGWSYWLGCANDKYIIRSVDNYGSLSFTNSPRILGIRPLIIVQTSDI